MELNAMVHMLMYWVSLTGPLSWSFGVEHRAGVVCVQLRLQEGHRHGSGQRRQTLPQSRQLSTGEDTPTHRHKHVHAYTHPQASMRTYTHTYKQTNMYTDTNSLTHAHVNTIQCRSNVMHLYIKRIILKVKHFYVYIL